MQPALLRQLLALGKPLVLVLYHGGIVTLPPDILKAPQLAVVSAGYPGMHGAAALAAALLDTDAEPATNRWGTTPDPNPNPNPSAHPHPHPAPNPNPNPNPSPHPNPGPNPNPNPYPNPNQVGQDARDLVL